MDTNIDINKINEKVQAMKGLMEELKAMGAEVPSLNRNLVRLSASIKMLRLNFSDVANFEEQM